MLKCFLLCCQVILCRSRELSAVLCQLCVACTELIHLSCVIHWGRGQVWVMWLQRHRRVGKAAECYRHWDATTELHVGSALALVLAAAAVAAAEDSGATLAVRLLHWMVTTAAVTVGNAASLLAHLRRRHCQPYHCTTALRNFSLVDFLYRITLIMFMFSLGAKSTNSCYYNNYLGAKATNSCYYNNYL